MQAKSICILSYGVIQISSEEVSEMIQIIYYAKLCFLNKLAKLFYYRQRKLKLIKFVDKRKGEIGHSLRSYLGSTGTVMKVIYSGKIAYEIKCPKVQCGFKGRGIDAHLIKNHSLDKNIVRFWKSYCIQMHSYLTKIVHNGIHEPLPCYNCLRYFDRLDLHLKNSHQASSFPKEMELCRNLDEKIANSSSIFLLDTINTNDS